MKRTNYDYKLMLYPIRLNIFDAVYVWQLNEQIKQKVFEEQEQQVLVLRLETGFSRRRCLLILRGINKLDDFACRFGYNTERRNINELQ